MVSDLMVPAGWQQVLQEVGTPATDPLRSPLSRKKEDLENLSGVRRGMGWRSYPPNHSPRL
jgi:hypothetical protein